MPPSDTSSTAVIAGKPSPAVATKPHSAEPDNLPCPRCDATNTKFCYYNNYNLSQPRYFCKACRRYWTRGGTLRNVPVGGGSRKNTSKRPRPSTASSMAPPQPPPTLLHAPAPVSTTSFLHGTLLEEDDSQLMNLNPSSLLSLISSNTAGPGFGPVFGFGPGGSDGMMMMNVMDSGDWTAGWSDCQQMHGKTRLELESDY